VRCNRYNNSAVTFRRHSFAYFAYFGKKVVETTEIHWINPQRSAAGSKTQVSNHAKPPPTHFCTHCNWNRFFLCESQRWWSIQWPPGVVDGLRETPQDINQHVQRHWTDHAPWLRHKRTRAAKLGVCASRKEGQGLPRRGRHQEAGRPAEQAAQQGDPGPRPQAQDRSQVPGIRGDSREAGVSKMQDGGNGVLFKVFLPGAFAFGWLASCCPLSPSNITCLRFTAPAGAALTPPSWFPWVAAQWTSGICATAPWSQCPPPSSMQISFTPPSSGFGLRILLCDLIIWVWLSGSPTAVVRWPWEMRPATWWCCPSRTCPSRHTFSTSSSKEPSSRPYPCSPISASKWRAWGILAIPGEGSKLELDQYIIEMVNIRNLYGKKIKKVLSLSW